MIFQQLSLPGTCVRFSPLAPNLLAYGGSENFGYAGNSLLTLFDFEVQTSTLKPRKRYPLKNCLQSIAFSEQNPNLVGVTTGGGEFALFDIASPAIIPTLSMRLFRKEALTLSNNRFLPFLFAAGSAEGELRLIDTQQKKLDALPLKAGNSSIGNQNLGNPTSPLNDPNPESIHEVHWHPNKKTVLGACTSHGNVYIKDLALPQLHKNALVIRNHGVATLSFDFNKYQPTVALGGIDNSVKIFDLRKPQMPLSVLTGHRYAISRVRFSPFSDSLLVSGSYDMTVKSWELKRLPQSPLVKTHARHREFVTDFDLSLFHQHYMVSCSLDRYLNVFHSLS